MFKLLINSGHTCWVTQEETVLNEQSVRNCGKKNSYLYREAQRRQSEMLTLEKIDKSSLYLRLAG